MVWYGVHGNYSNEHLFYWCSTSVACPSGQSWNETTQQCEAPLLPAPPLHQTSSNCGIGNPCDPATGNKYLPSETDSVAVATGLGLTRSYNSQLTQDLGLGFGWSGLGAGRLKIYTTTVHVIEPSGRGEVYTCPSGSGACTGNADSDIALTKDTSGFTLTRRDGTSERYDTAGLLLTRTDRNGLVTTYAHASGQLAQITGPFGHTQSFTYAGNHIASISDPNGVYQYTYDANNNLAQVTYPDGSGKRYHYENASFPNHLTGISYVEVNGSVTRYATYSYDASGKAVSTEHAGGAERFTLQYDSDTQTTVTDAANTQEVMTFAPNLGVKNLVAKVNGADGKSLAQTFDANNNLTCKKDEEGRVVTYTYNATNQRLSQTEGLTGSCTAPQTTSATRTTSYSYVSATLDVPTLIQGPSVHAGSSKSTSLSYGDARFPTLPTGITQSGYTPSGAAINRTITLTYNSTGQVTSINGLRIDVNDITALAYYTCTTGNACGQLASVTNALGQVTTYDSYDGNGRLVQMTDPNGLRTTYGYDARGRVITITQTPPGGPARVTGYSYNAAGNVTGVTYPDGRTLTYTYNAAQQLTQVTDNAGNRVTYGYDLKGNRTGAFTYDPDGTLVRSMETAYDPRNHVQQLNQGGSVTQQVVDALGNLTRSTDPNQVASGGGIGTTHTYDALSRLIQTLDNLNGNTSYGYNPHDRLTQVTAPNGAMTQYVYDDLGNLLQEISPDRGTTTYGYDAAGNVTSRTEARGITVGYAYDALNRITRIDYPADTDTVFAYDAGADCTNGVGRLCQVVDGSGTTEYGYDAFGNVTVQVKTELGVTYTTRYGYDAGDRVVTITYPDNRAVTYTRDTLGRITDVTTTVNGSPQPLVSARAYRADGVLLSQTYGNGLNETRQYDQKGQLTYQSLGTADTRVYTYDPNGNQIQKQTLPEVASYTYDALDRLVHEASATLTADFGYDANGNRLSASVNTLDATLGYAPNSNRLTSVTAGSFTDTPGLDPAGNLTSLLNGRITLAYDEAGRLAVVRAGSTVIARYVYNAHGQRTRKTAGSTTTVYHYDLAGNLIAETTANGTPIRTYVHADDSPLAQLDRVIVKKTPADRLVYLHTDHLDTPRVGTDAGQTVRWRWDGDAFGATPPNEDPDGDGKKAIINLRGDGLYADQESSLWLNGDRYYSPILGRFITADRTSVVEHVQRWQAYLGTPDQLPLEINSYARVANNPLRYVDPTGLELQFTIGISGSFGGSPIIVPPGVFAGGGLSIGFTSSGQLIIQAQATGSVGGGAYAGVGAQAGVAKSKCPTESGISVQRSLQGDFNFGAGPSVGGSIQYDGNGGGGIQAGVGKIGVGYGLQVSGGVTQTVTIATPALFSIDTPCGCR